MPVYARYLFSEESGGTAVAEIGSNGTYQGSPTLRALGPGGLRRYAVELNGSSQWVEIPKPADFTNVYQIVVWVRVNDGTGGTRQCILDGRDATDDGLALFVDGDSFRLEHNGTVVDAGTVIDADGGWRCVVAALQSGTASIRFGDSLPTVRGSATSQANLSLAATTWTLGKDQLDNDNYLSGKLGFFDISNYNISNIGTADILFDQARPYFTTYPKVIGTPVVGETLSVSWAAVDQNSYTASYEWYRTNADGTRTLIGSSATYTLTASEAGLAVDCQVTLTDIDGAGLSSFTAGAGTTLTVFDPAMPYIAAYATTPFLTDQGGGGTGIHPVYLPPVQAGDLLLTFISSINQCNPQPPDPVGWTFLGVQGNGDRTAVYYKYCDGNEPDSALFNTQNSYMGLYACVVAIRNAADPADRPPVGVFTANTEVDGTCVAPEATVAYDNSLALYHYLNLSTGNVGSMSGINNAVNFWSVNGGGLSASVRSAYGPLPLAAGVTPSDVTCTGIPTWTASGMATIVIPPPASGGSHSLTADPLSSGTPTLGSPALAQNHSISAPDLTGGTIFFESPTVSQNHAFTASALTSGTPVLDSPALGQAGDLTANPLSAGTPTLASPALNQTHVFTASALSAGSPTLGSPVLNQTHVLTASPLAAGSPTLASPALNQVHVLTAPTAISSGAPTLASPSLNQTHVLTANPLSSGVPELASPVLGQPGQIAANPLSTGSPTLGTPSLSQVHVSTANALSASAPTLASPALSQVHVLGTDGASAGSPTLGSPALSVVHNLVPSALSSGTPVLDSPILGIDGLMTALPLDAGTPTLDSPALSQVHVLSLVALSTGLPTLPTPLLNWDQIPYTPSYLRTFYPPVSLPERTVPQVSFGNRTFALPYYSGRTFPQVPYDHRTGIPNGS